MKRRFAFLDSSFTVSDRQGNQGQAPHRKKETARRLSANQAMDQGKPPPERATVHQGIESAITRAIITIMNPGNKRIHLPLL